MSSTSVCRTLQTFVSDCWAAAWLSHSSLTNVIKSRQTCAVPICVAGLSFLAAQSNLNVPTNACVHSATVCDTATKMAATTITLTVSFPVTSISKLWVSSASNTWYCAMKSCRKKTQYISHLQLYSDRVLVICSDSFTCTRHSNPRSRAKLLSGEGREERGPSYLLNCMSLLLTSKE